MQRGSIWKIKLLSPTCITKKFWLSLEHFFLYPLNNSHSDYYRMGGDIKVAPQEILVSVWCGLEHIRITLNGFLPWFSEMSKKAISEMTGIQQEIRWLTQLENKHNMDGSWKVVIGPLQLSNTWMEVDRYCQAHWWICLIVLRFVEVIFLKSKGKTGTERNEDASFNTRITNLVESTKTRRAGWAKSDTLADVYTSTHIRTHEPVQYRALWC